MARWRCSPATAIAVRNLETDTIDKPVNQIEWDLATIERGGYRHFMLKEIFEQPESLEQHAARPPARRRGHRAACSGLNMTDEELKPIDRIVITACGTSWHSGLIGEYMLEELARHPGGSGVRLGVPLPQPGGGREDAGHRDLPVGRDGRHAGGDPRGEAARARGRWAW